MKLLMFFLVFLRCFSVALAQDSPGLGGPKSGKVVNQPQTEKFIENKILPHILERKSRVEQDKKEISESIEAWGNPKGGEGWENFHGNEPEDVVTNYTNDAKEMIEKFSEVNGYPAHTFEQIMTPPVAMPWECGIHYQYLGPEAGTCYWVKPSPDPLCGYMFYTTASLVAYYYPAYKIDVSEQLYQSLYYPNTFVEADLIPQNEKDFYPLAADSAANTMNRVQEITADEMDKWGYSHTKPRTDAKPSQDAVDQLVDNFDSKQRHSAPSASKAYARTFFEPLDLLTENIPHIPHFSKYHFFGTDMPAISGAPASIQSAVKGFIDGMSGIKLGGTDYGNSPYGSGLLGKGGNWDLTNALGSTMPSLGANTKSGYLYSKIFMKSFSPIGHNSEWPDKIKAFNEFGPRRCVKNNKHTGKTPQDMDISPGQGQHNSDKQRTSASDICMDKIGETFPFTDDRRPHITDATWAGAWRMLKLFHYLHEVDDERGRYGGPGAPRHSFIRDIDKWYVIRNEALKNESPGASPIDEMTKVNLEYKEANIKRGRSGGENTIEIWPLFKGCWLPVGAKGAEPDYFLETPRLGPPGIPPFPSPDWAPNDLPGELRFY